MRRAIRLATLALIALASGAAGPTRTPSPGNEPQAVTSINGIGLVDYSRRPTFKVGDWARYHMTGSSQLGMHDDYVVTVLIGGEEEWWGEPCFWVETWTDVPHRPLDVNANCMSYAIFDDSLSLQRIQMYLRKTIAYLNEDGTPHQELNKAASSTLKMREAVARPVHWSTDTLPPDTVITPMGTYRTTPVRLRQGTGGTGTVADSSVYTEVRENRTMYYTLDVPITHVAREDVESIIARRTWLVGRSEEAAPLNTRDRGLGVARLIACGHGLEARLVPVAFRRSLAEQEAKARTAASPGTPRPRRRAR
ncbi:MAG TPA: hypothetical protein VGU27_08520 [Candidatus Eisenbacteria bacterium]|nr:hypothetical protein [Candidatus Eisenbacteria bacterium]